jgi:hypothetical protein
MAEIQLMTPDAVCKALAISPTTLWRLSKCGQLVPNQLADALMEIRSGLGEQFALDQKRWAKDERDSK